MFEKGKKFWDDCTSGGCMSDKELYDLLSSMTAYEFDAGALIWELEEHGCSSEHVKNMTHSEIAASFEDDDPNDALFEIVRSRGVSFYFPAVALLQDGYRSLGPEATGVLTSIDEVCECAFEKAYEQRRNDVIRHIVEEINPPVSDVFDFNYVRSINGKEYGGDFMLLAVANEDQEMIKYLEKHGYSQDEVVPIE